MALTDIEKTEAARELARRLFVEINATATLNVNDLKAAVGSIDTAMNATGAQVNSQYPGLSLEQAINQNFPEPFQSTATLAQKALAMALWAMKRGGLI